MIKIMFEAYKKNKHNTYISNVVNLFKRVMRQNNIVMQHDQSNHLELYPWDLLTYIFQYF